MKRQLRQIYDDLSKRKLSQEQALEQLRALKVRSRGMGSLFAVPVWRERGKDSIAGGEQPEYKEHHVMVCGLSKVEVERLGREVPQSECVELDGGVDKTIAEQYSEYALGCFERIRCILQGKQQGRVLVQI